MTKLEEIFGAGMDTVEADLSIVSEESEPPQEHRLCRVA